MMALDLGPKSNETIDESAINAGIAEYVMGVSSFFIPLSLR